MRGLLFFCLGVACAVAYSEAQTTDPNGGICRPGDPCYSLIPGVRSPPSLDLLNRPLYMNAGVGPDNNMAPIRVDKDGYVICSKESAP